MNWLRIEGEKLIYVPSERLIALGNSNEIARIALQTDTNLVKHAIRFG